MDYGARHVADRLRPNCGRVGIAEIARPRQTAGQTFAKSMYCSLDKTRHNPASPGLNVADAIVSHSACSLFCGEGNFLS
jgi:hypothetical protein